MKVTKILDEGKRIEFDQNGFEKAVYPFVQRALDKLPFNVNFDGINITKIEKTKSPIRFNIDIDILISGTDLITKYKHYQKGTQILVKYWFYGLPGNTDITEDTLKNLPTYNQTIEEHIIQRILSEVTTKDDANSRVNSYKQKFNEVQHQINNIEKEYNVELEFNLYPDENGFSKDSEGYYSFTVYVRDIKGCLGKFISPKPGAYYEYTVNGESYSTFLRYKDQHIIAGYSWYETKVPLNEFDVTDFSNMIKRELSALIERVKVLDYLITNENNIKKEFNISLQKLEKKYSKIKIGMVTIDFWAKPDPIYVYVTSLSYNEEFVFSLEDISTKEGINNAITKIQRKIYKLLKTPNTNVKPHIKKFIEENSALLTTDPDEFFRLAEMKEVDLRMLAYVLTSAGISIRYKLSNIPDIIKDII